MTNRLAQESSPYLQQHAGNPVDWYPWGEAAFAQARERNLPVHLSIGYFACHWCHVMAQECFEDPQIAAQLNENFINVKVDRQERPDVDELYQRVVQMMGQAGGWPLTVFLTPRQEPFFAGTYFPPQDRYGRPGFARLLNGLSLAWRSKQHEVKENCEQFVRGFATHDEQLFAPEPPGRDSAPGGAAQIIDEPAQAALAFARATDPVHGGLGGTPKFPNASAHDLMLRVAARTRAAPVLAALERTLDGMAAGGIHDHLGGGFCRYSVDEVWAVPHFEKMLYDNAQLIKLYADAYRLTGKASWRHVFERTSAYLMRDLAHPGGAFFASEDADSQGEEGRYYVWNPQEIRAVLGDADGAFACRAYSVGEVGNFTQGRSVLNRFCALEPAELARLEQVRRHLFVARQERARPARDENILTGWNGLAIQGLCAAYQATGDAAYLAAARAAADFLAAHLRGASGSLCRAWRDGVSQAPAFLDDYAFLANGLFDLYASDFAHSDLDRAVELVDEILARFWDDGLYFTPADAPALVHRPIAPFDNAWPSGMSEGVLALLRAYALTARPLYRESALRILERYGPARARNAFGFAHLLAAQEYASAGMASLLFSGSRTACQSLIATVHRRYLPGYVLGLLADGPAAPVGAGAAPAPAVQLCRNQTCLPAAHSVGELDRLLA